MILLGKSQGMKNCKNPGSFYLRILFIKMTGPNKFWHVYCCNVYLFSVRFLNMCKPKTILYLLWQASPPEFRFYGSRPAGLLSWLGIVNAGRLSSMESEIFLKMKFIIFQGCSRKQTVFSPRQRVPYIIWSLFSHFYLFQDVLLQKMSKFVSWNFKLIFLGIQFSLVAKCFSQILIICLGWCLHLKLFHEF